MTYTKNQKVQHKRLPVWKFQAYGRKACHRGALWGSEK